MAPEEPRKITPENVWQTLSEDQKKAVASLIERAQRSQRTLSVQVLGGIAAFLLVAWFLSRSGA